MRKDFISIAVILTLVCSAGLVFFADDSDAKVIESKTVTQKVRTATVATLIVDSDSIIPSSNSNSSIFLYEVDSEGDRNMKTFVDNPEADITLLPSDTMEAGKKYRIYVFETCEPINVACHLDYSLDVGTKEKVTLDILKYQDILDYLQKEKIRSVAVQNDGAEKLTVMYGVSYFMMVNSMDAKSVNAGSSLDITPFESDTVVSDWRLFVIAHFYPSKVSSPDDLRAEYYQEVNFTLGPCWESGGNGVGTLEVAPLFILIGLGFVIYKVYKSRQPFWSRK